MKNPEKANVKLNTPYFLPVYKGFINSDKYVKITVYNIPTPILLIKKQTNKNINEFSAFKEYEWCLSNFDLNQRKNNNLAFVNKVPKHATDLID